MKMGKRDTHSKYIDGKPDGGTHTEYDHGRLVANIEYNEGNIISEYHVVHDEDGLTEYYKKDGVLNGKWTRWYPVEIRQKKDYINRESAVVFGKVGLSQ